MTGSATERTGETPAAKQKRVWDKSAPSYDRQIAFFEKIQFGGGRDPAGIAAPAPGGVRFAVLLTMWPDMTRSGDGRVTDQ